MVWIDNFGFHVDKNNYIDAPSTYAAYKRTITGALSIVESGIFEQALSFQLNVSQSEYELLSASFGKCHSTTPVYLNFIDLRGVRFDPAAGSDTPTHKFNSGVWFESLGEAKPTELLFGPLGEEAPLPWRRFVVAIKLLANTKALA